MSIIPCEGTWNKSLFIPWYSQLNVVRDKGLKSFYQIFSIMLPIVENKSWLIAAENVPQNRKIHANKYLYLKLHNNFFTVSLINVLLGASGSEETFLQAPFTDMLALYAGLELKSSIDSLDQKQAEVFILSRNHIDWKIHRH